MEGGELRVDRGTTLRVVGVFVSRDARASGWRRARIGDEKSKGRSEQAKICAGRKMGAGELRAESCWLRVI